MLQYKIGLSQDFAPFWTLQTGNICETHMNYDMSIAKAMHSILNTSETKTYSPHLFGQRLPSIAPVQAQAFRRSREENGGDEAAVGSGVEQAEGPQILNQHSLHRLQSRGHDIVRLISASRPTKLHGKNVKTHLSFVMKAHEAKSQPAATPQGSSEYIIQTIQ